MFTKHAGLACLLILLAAALPACMPAPETAPASPTPVTQSVERQVEQPAAPTQAVERAVALQSGGQKVLRRASRPVGDLATLDPALSMDIKSAQWVDMTTVGLTYLNQEDGSLQPGLAERWDVSPDGRTYTFHLRADVPWVRWDQAQQAVVKVQTCPDAAGKTADRMVRARDFEYAILRALKPETASSGSLQIKGANAYNSGAITDTGQVGVKALDERTLQVEFLEPAAYNAIMIGLWPAHAVPRWLIEGDACTKALADRWTETGNFQGYGPYTLKEWVHDAEATFAKNPFWPGTPAIPQARIATIVERFLEIPASLSEYEAGNLEESPVPLSDIDRVRTDARLGQELSASPEPATYYLGFNTKAPAVADVRVRRALSLAIDRQALVDNVAKTGSPAQWLCRPGVPGCPDPKDYPGLGVGFDVARARSELAGYLQDHGTTADKLSLTLMYPASADPKRLMEAVQQMWRDNLGVDVHVIAQEGKVLIKTIKDPQNTPPLFFTGWSVDYPDANNFECDLVAFGCTNGTQPGGGFNWKNDKYAELARRAAVEPDPRQRAALYAEAEKILTWEDAILIPLIWAQTPWLRKPYVAHTASSTGEAEFNKWDIDVSQIK